MSILPEFACWLRILGDESDRIAATARRVVAAAKLQPAGSWMTLSVGMSRTRFNDRLCNVVASGIAFRTRVRFPPSPHKTLIPQGRIRVFSFSSHIFSFPIPAPVNPVLVLCAPFSLRDCFGIDQLSDSVLAGYCERPWQLSAIISPRRFVFHVFHRSISQPVQNSVCG